MHNSRVDKNWQDLVQRVPSDCRRCYAHLTQHPLERDRGRAFPMLGDHKPAWEYRVNGSDRVFYVVFPKEKKVRVYYAGPHYRGRRPPLPPVRP